MQRSALSLPLTAGLLALLLGLTASLGPDRLAAQVWEPVGPDLGTLLDGVDTSVRSLYFHPHGDRQRFFVLGGSKLWQVDHDGETWQYLDSPPATDFPVTFQPASQAFAVDPLDPGHFVWAVFGRLLRTLDDGQSWDQYRIFEQSGASELHFNPEDPSIVYMVGFTSEDAESDPTAYRSWDGGKTWQNWNIPGVFVHRFLRFAPGDAQHLYVGGDGLYHSTDGGETWSTLLAFDLDTFEPYINDLAFGGNDPEVLYLVAEFKLLRSTDAGATFTPVAAAEGLVLSAVETDPHDSQVFFVATTAGEVLRSTDGGATLTPFSTGLPTGQPLRDLAVEPRFGGLLYALTSGQLYRIRFAGSEPTRTCRTCAAPALAATTSPAPAPAPATLLRSGLSRTPGWSPTVLAPSAAVAGQEEGTWQALGPNGGPIHHLATCPSEVETVYAAARQHVFVSTNSAQSWQVAGMVPEGEVRELYCDAADASRLYADTGTDGLWRSDDAGASWQALATGLLSGYPYAQRLAVHPQAGGTLYLAAGSIYRSLDAGDTWQPRFTGDPSFCRLAPLAAGGSALLAQPCELGTPLLNRQFGVWRSDDDGSTWQQQSSNPLGPRLFGDPATPDRWSAIGYLRPLLETFDGQRWYPRGSGLPAARLQDLAVHPLSPTVRLAATSDQLLRSSDDGATYSPVTDPDLDGETLHAVRYAPDLGSDGTGPRAYLATDTGILRTRGGGLLWTPMDSGLQAWPVDQLQALASTPGYLLLLSAGHGWRSLDAGATWQRLGEPSAGDTLCLAAAPSNPQVLYAGSWRTIWRSDDGGASWVQSPDLFAFEPRSLAVHPNDPMTVYAGGLFKLEDTFTYAYLYSSTDGGTSWTSAPGNLQRPTFHRVSFDPQDPSRIYAAGPGVFRRVGNAWQQITNWTFLDGPTVFDLAFDPTQPGTFFLATAEAGVLRGDASGTVTPAGTQGLPTGPVRAVTVAGDGTIYAGLDTGIYLSTDGGATWQPAPAASRGALSRGITALATDAAGGIYAGTVDLGVYGLR